MPSRNRRDFSIRDLRAFITILQHGSLTKAAKQLNVSQPAISSQIRRLEALAGGILFVKTARGHGLSELGLRLEQYARRLVALNDQAMATSVQDPNDRTISVAVQGAFACGLFPDLLRLFETNAATDWKLYTNSGPALVEKFKNGDLDLAAMIAPPAPLPNVAAEWMEQLVWVRGRHRSPLSVGEPVPLIARNYGYIEGKAFDALTEQNVHYRVVLQAGDMATMVAAAEAGVGVFALPERCVPAPLMIARDAGLPKLSRVRAGVFYRDGFDLGRFKAELDAFVGIVQPSAGAPRKRRRDD